MKAPTTTLSPAATEPALPSPARPAKGRISRRAIWLELFKARLSALVVMTTLVGFYIGYQGAIDWTLMFHAVAGTAFLAAGAGALNQLLEREHDALMARTEHRPLPARHLTPGMVLWVGVGISIVGIVELMLFVNALTAILGAVTLISYLFVYTPLKRVTPLNTVIGAIPGALPPLMGWTAARGELSIEGWALFAILFFWQLPHFLALAWMYRDEYREAGFAMLPCFDTDGRRTARQALSHTFGLVPLSFAPFAFGLSGRYYFAAAFLLSIYFLWAAFRFSRHLDRPSARKLFLASILYLPLLLVMMVMDKTKL
ncbi:MAG TPA: protoheme IX farnesyltransferase [Verrucomicrobiales bacterium]|nr:protoheme IX farnesyltransferase [Verrucomicrobiales bacterium]